MVLTLETMVERVATSKSCVPLSRAFLNTICKGTVKNGRAIH